MMIFLFRVSPPKSLAAHPAAKKGRISEGRLGYRPKEVETWRGRAASRPLARPATKRPAKAKQAVRACIPIAAAPDFAFSTVD
jgi:hypothetical protein